MTTLELLKNEMKVMFPGKVNVQHRDDFIDTFAEKIWLAAIESAVVALEKRKQEYFLEVFSYPLNSKPISGKTVMRETGRGDEVDDFEIWESTLSQALASLLALKKV